MHGAGKYRFIISTQVLKGDVGTSSSILECHLDRINYELAGIAYADFNNLSTTRSD